MEFTPTSSPDFLEDGFILTKDPLDSSDFDAYIDDLLRIDPRLMNGMVYGNEVEIHKGEIHGDIHATQQVQEKVGYRVITLFDEESNSNCLVYVYVYQDKIVLEKILELLAGLEVSNSDDLFTVKVRLMDTYLSSN